MGGARIVADAPEGQTFSVLDLFQLSVLGFLENPILLDRVRQYAVQSLNGGSTVLGKEKRTTRLEARITPDALAVVRRAAEIEGRSVSDFVVTAAQEAAHRTIEETHLIRISIEDQRRFVELLLDPPAANPALERARQAHDGLIRSVS
jgi:uncharacterized protein (DUF1778 family)